MIGVVSFLAAWQSRLTRLVTEALVLYAIGTNLEIAVPVAINLPLAGDRVRVGVIDKILLRRARSEEGTNQGADREKRQTRPHNLHDGSLLCFYWSSGWQ
jgi:hypothetical protein